MAAPTKSKRNEVEDQNEIPTKLSSQEKNDIQLTSFLKWSDDNKFRMNVKVRVGKKGSCAQYGMIAEDDIKEGECLFEVPRSILLHGGTSSISNLLKNEADDLLSESGWVPLLISLMYEYNNPTSTWRPYLDLVPDFKELNLPMFWESEERKSLLKGTGVDESVTRDINLLTNDFNNVVLPFINKHPDIFLPICKDIEFYKKMVAFVMAYSFTETNLDESSTEANTPMMVPMADILNSIAKNNAHLEFHPDVLKMVAVKDICKGEEVFNSYGDPANAHLLQMYGYAEEYPNNHNDTVEISNEALLKATKQLTDTTDKIFYEKLGVLQDMEAIDDENTLVIGKEGILTEDECQQLIKVIFMSESQFQDFVEKGGWSDADEDDDEPNNIFSFENIPSLSPDWKNLLSRAGEESLTRYKTTLEEDQKLSSQDIASLTSHHKYSFYTAYGQKMLLKKLVDACNK